MNMLERLKRSLGIRTDKQRDERHHRRAFQKEQSARLKAAPKKFVPTTGDPEYYRDKGATSEGDAMRKADAARQATYPGVKPRFPEAAMQSSDIPAPQPLQKATAATNSIPTIEQRKRKSSASRF